MKKSDVLKKCKKLKKDNPNMTGTEMAISIAGGYTTPLYNSVIHIINDLRGEGQL